MHRPANVDDAGQLETFVRTIGESAQGLPVVFPVHPRTAGTLARLGGLPPNIHPVEPLAYLEFNYLVERARAVITDSGASPRKRPYLAFPA